MYIVKITMLKEQKPDFLSFQDDGVIKLSDNLNDADRFSTEVGASIATTKAVKQLKDLGFVPLKIEMDVVE